MKCIIDDCEKSAVCRGMCKRHYDQELRTRPPIRVLRYTILCQHCGRTVQTYRSDQQYCDRTCFAKARVIQDREPCAVDECVQPAVSLGLCNKHYYHASKPQTLICKQCGTTYRGHPGQQYCTLSCANTGRTPWNKKSTSLVSYTGPAYQRAPRPNINPIRITSRTFRAGRCRQCGSTFVSLNLDMTCSPACWEQDQQEQKRIHKDRRRARKKQAYVADVWRTRVFEADSYRCHMCNRKTNPNKATPHPLAPTIDHLIPLARGGTHEPANCRTACFECNCLKGDRGGGEQLAIF